MIDSRALIDSTARLAEEVQIGPYSVIGADVEIGTGTWIGPHVVVNRLTRIGCNNQIHPFSTIGGPPQDRSYRAEISNVEIGHRNVIREGCTINCGTAKGDCVTRIGDDNWLMAYVHIAHDCRIGDHTLFINNATLAGHVSVENHAVLGSFVTVHQFCTVGAYSFSTAGSIIRRDIPPYIAVSGYKARPVAVNSKALKTHGFSAVAIRRLQRAFNILYRSDLTLVQALERLRELVADSAEIRTLLNFIERSERGVIR